MPELLEPAPSHPVLQSHPSTTPWPTSPAVPEVRDSALLPTVHPDVPLPDLTAGGAIRVAAELGLRVHGHPLTGAMWLSRLSGRSMDSPCIKIMPPHIG